MRGEILLSLVLLIMCSFHKCKCYKESTDELRTYGSVAENSEDDTSIINLKVPNNYMYHSRSAQLPTKRSSDKKPADNKKKSGKSKEKQKIRSTTDRVDEDTQAEQNELTTTAEVKRSMSLEDEEPKASEESQSANKEDTESLDEDIEYGITPDPNTAMKYRMGNLLRKTEHLMKIKESFEEGTEESRRATAEMDQTAMMNMEEKLDQLIGKLLQESEEAERRASTSTPSEAHSRKVHLNPLAVPRSVMQSKCDTCYNPIQQIISRVHPIIPALVNEFPRRVIVRPRFRSVIYY